MTANQKNISDLKEILFQMNQSKVSKDTSLKKYSVTHYVGFDGGSGLMAACFENRDNPHSYDIPLQYYASELLGKNYPFFHKQDGCVSPWLKNHFVLKGGTQPYPLPDYHARLNFIDSHGKKTSDYEKSVFELFYPGKWIAGGRRVIPNPKLLYLEGIQTFIPKIKKHETEETGQLPGPKEQTLKMPAAKAQLLINV